MGMQRKPFVQRFNFAGSTAGVTDNGEPLDVSQFAFGGLHVDAGLDGRIITFTDNGVWGSHVVLTKALTTGFVAFTQDDLLALGPSMQLTATLNTSATGNCWLKMKS
jgi:hypothetical protein